MIVERRGLSSSRNSTVVVVVVVVTAPTTTTDRMRTTVRQRYVRRRPLHRPRDPATAWNVGSDGAAMVRVGGSGGGAVAAVASAAALSMAAAAVEQGCHARVRCNRFTNIGRTNLARYLVIIIDDK